jgi:acyl transferase domain-containing protein
MYEATLQEPAESVAIIGMRGRFPGANTVEQFWKNLCDGVESIVTFTDEELAAAGVDQATKSIPGFVPRGGPLANVEYFDASFFGFSPRDAEVIDPQQRLFLECCWASLEEAGYNPDRYHGLIGVYGGSDQSSYAFQLYEHGAKYLAQPMASIGNDKDYLTTQVSYKLNLSGPSLAVQTSCSTSLVAVTLACQSLLTYQCDMALAGGVCVIVPQTKGYFYQPGGIVSPDGHCRTFDAAGQGTVVSSGVGVVVLKRLSEALAAGDQIYAIVKGAALNNDGAKKVGYGAPSVEGQAQVIAMAQALAGVLPETIEMVEAHGTATLLGDPIEMAALNQVFTASTSKRGYCAIGSAKSNVGHLASAAGVTGLIKAALALKHEAIPPSLLFHRPNPQINFAASPFFVNTTLREWRRRDGEPRRAAVSSFGVGGTNAHAVLEEAPQREASGPSRPYQLMVLSTKTPTALEAATDNLASHVEQQPELALADVAYTLQIGRKEFRHRRMLLCHDGDSQPAVAAALRQRNPQRVFTSETETKDRPTLFMFSGQGSQYVNMGRDLFASEPTFRAQVEYCAQILQPYLGLDLCNVLYPPEEQREEAAAQLTQTAITQPALFTIEFALACVWMEWGILPKAMLGHSIGEYVAACLAGVFTLEEALAVVAYRGYLMDQMPAGSMLALPLAEQEAIEVMGDELSLAAINGPRMCVVSGPTEAIAALEAQVTERGIQGRRLHTSHAFHSAMMDPVVDQFVEALRAVPLKPPQIPFFSNLTGGWAAPELVMDPTYWGRHLRHTVRFSDNLRELLRIPELIYLEVGPGQSLSTLVRQQPGRATDQLILPSMRSPHEQDNDVETLLTSLGRMWLAGMAVHWEGFAMHERRHRVSLPTYPFECQRYWVDPPAQSVRRHATAASRQQDVTQWFYIPSWKPAAPARPSDPDLEVGTRWLVFAEDSAISGGVMARLREKGLEVVTVRAGSSFRRLDADSYSIRPPERADYDSLLKELKSEGRTPDYVLHLWGAAEIPDGNGPDVFQNEQYKGFYSLVFYAQALESQRITQRVQLGAVTRGLHAVFGDEPLCPPRATMLGACRVIPQEYPHLRCRAIDVAADAPEMAEQLIRELVFEPFSSAVSYRNGRRWVQVYESMPLAKADAKALPLRDHGVYAITGGLGKIGLALAEFLARTVQARLVLIGRSGLPDRAQWQDWIAQHDAYDITSRRIQRVLELEKLGADVAVFAADSADSKAMGQAIQGAIERFGELHGIIHGAGNTAADGFGPLTQVTPQAAEAQFRPKAYGVHVLEDLLAGRPLDFCVMLSSLSAVLGGLGMLSYASANAYLDAVAASCSQPGAMPWSSINWDAWQFPEDNVSGAGMEEAILPEAGVEAFCRILGSASRQVVVSTSDLQARLNKWINLETLKDQKHELSDQGGLHARPNLSSEYVEPRNDTERTIAQVWQQILGVAPIGIYDKFFELGGHSLLAIQLISDLRDAFQVELSAQRLFEAPTIAQLAESIEQEISQGRAQEAEREQQRLEEMLDMVENLSDEEVADLLARHGELTEEATHGGD